MDSSMREELIEAKMNSTEYYTLIKILADIEKSVSKLVTQQKELLDLLSNKQVVSCSNEDSDVLILSDRLVEISLRKLNE